MTREEGFDKFVEECVKRCKQANFTTWSQVFGWLNKTLQKQYLGKASREKIKSVAEDFTESICLKMGIPQD